MVEKRITIVEVNDIMNFPPVISLVENLLANNHFVTLIALGAKNLPFYIIQNKNFNYVDLNVFSKNKNIFIKVKNRIYKNYVLKKDIRYYMKNSDILWTTSAKTIRDLGSIVLEYKNVLQLMELTQNIYLYKNFYCLHLGKIAKKSWKVVTAEINRAYIQKVWWELDNLPYVLPNKPYNINPGEISADMDKILIKIKNEKRKVLLYLGGIWPDRDLKVFAEAVKILDNKYCLYIIGKAFGQDSQRELDELIEKYDVVYLGSFIAPKHLAFVQYAHIGLLPYKPTKSADVSELNALYCAPNKIYEYAGYGIPMLGTDVLGLRIPFEMYGIGYCCKNLNVNDIVDAIKKIDKDYKNMQKQCYKFYGDTDLDKIVKDIIAD